MGDGPQQRGPDQCRALRSAAGRNPSNPRPDVALLPELMPIRKGARKRLRAPASGVLLHSFSMQRQVETLTLGLLRHTQANEDPDDNEDDQTDHEVIAEHDPDTDA